VAGDVAAIVMAGGSGTRMGMTGNKVYLPLGGRPALERPVAVLAACGDVAVIVLVIRPEDADDARAVADAVGAGKVVAMVPGGVTRHDSEQAGLAVVRALVDDGAALDLVLVHDGARPFLTTVLLDALVDGARRVGGSVPVLGFAEPIAAVDEGGGLAMVDTADLVRVQTPQVFAADVLLAAYAAARADGFDGVDTAEVVERYAVLDVAAVPGDPRNVKVTTVADVAVAEELAALLVDGRWTDVP
jgi:2-C-methyl-D-erythritol 4-phosphate cytidylyltransferase